MGKLNKYYTIKNANVSAELLYDLQTIILFKIILRAPCSIIPMEMDQRFICLSCVNNLNKS